MADNPLYIGNVRVYLEGKSALLPLEIYPPKLVSYSIGSEKTNLIIKDYRRNPNRAAQNALSGNEEVEFADIFNQPAWIEVTEETENIEITMHESLSQGEFPYPLVRRNKRWQDACPQTRMGGFAAR
jgi:hypothetical protein